LPYFVVTRKRSAGWDWSVPMRRQRDWDKHAAFMNALESEGFIVAGGPLGGEDDAEQVLHVIEAPDKSAIEKRMAEDPWTPDLLQTGSIQPWTVLLGGFGKTR
jgi:uncharacterized protein YciI